MKLTKWIVILLINFTVLPGVCATRKNVEVTRNLIYDIEMVKAVKRINGVHYVPCHIRFTDLRYGMLDDDTYFRKKFPFTADCFNVDEGRVQGWAEFDSENNKWQPRYIDEEDRTQRQAVTKLYPVKAINSQGYVVTVDDFTGEESLRSRNMHFCLLHPPIAFCGDAPVMQLNEPESSALPYVLEILKTIEFVDDDSVQSSSPSPVQDKSMP